MKISIIIPTLNASAHMEKLFSMLQAQDIKFLEIIIIDSSSGDNTVDIAKGFGAKTIVIPRHTFNHGKTRNMAAMEAKGDILVFMTQDALPLDDKLLRKLTTPLKVSDIAATYGRHIPRPGASPLEIFTRQFSYPDTGSIKRIEDIKQYGIKTFRFSNVCSAIKKELFLKVGMFPEGIRANEDMLMAAKLILNGYRVAYVPEAMVIHSHNYSLLQQFRRYYNIGSSFKNNSWILKYARAEGEGMKFIKEQVSFVLKQHKYLWIPYIFLESLTKYAGYRIGLIAG
ncbi:MAG: glycosyltransferase family A protein [Nitrospirota bacterium]|nr:glycosyltransferase family A protein [Nitrospirota bacterium]